MSGYQPLPITVYTGGRAYRRDGWLLRYQADLEVRIVNSETGDMLALHRIAGVKAPTLRSAVMLYNLVVVPLQRVCNPGKVSPLPTRARAEVTV